MTRLVIKPIADRDEYIAWSTVVEAPLSGGTRAEMLRWVANRHGMDRGPGGAEKLMARVDECGTSIKQDPDSTFQWREGEWSDDSFIYEQIGTIAREKMYPMFRLLVEGREREALDLLEPLEDDPEYPGEMSGRLQATKDRLDGKTTDAAGC
jgi:hypothetical protein